METLTVKQKIELPTEDRIIPIPAYFKVMEPGGMITYMRITKKTGGGLKYCKVSTFAADPWVSYCSNLTFDFLPATAQDSTPAEFNSAIDKALGTIESVLVSMDAEKKPRHVDGTNVAGV